MSIYIIQTKETCLTNRLYLIETKDPQTANGIVFKTVRGQQGPHQVERRGLGMTCYGEYLGRFMSLIGLAFKAVDDQGHTYYINEESFCKLAGRVSNVGQPFGGRLEYGNIDKAYKEKKEEENRTVSEIFFTFIPKEEEKISDLYTNWIKNPFLSKRNYGSV